jgi:hypothetical protein
LTRAARPADEGQDTVGIEHVQLGGVLYAIIVRGSYDKPGVHFFTPDHFSQQVGYMAHPAGHVIAAHTHREVARSVHRTQEVLVLRKGRLRVDFYDGHNERQASRIMEAGDVILLVQGGHGFEVIEQCEMFEIKQGPFTGDEDKVLISPVDSSASS